MKATPIRLLIAGCGDLGIRVAKKMLDDSDSAIWGLRRTIDYSANTPTGLTWIAADLSKPETLSLLPSTITHILFVAAPNARTEIEYRNVYFNGLQHLVRQLHTSSLTRIIFISSSAVYGEHGDEWVDEETPVNPQGFNGRILFESEQWLKQFGLQHAIHTICLRLSGLYGPGRSQLLEKLKYGQIGAPMSASHWANRIHVDDAANAITHLMRLNHPSDSYVVTDNTPIQLRLLYEYLAGLVGGPIPNEAAAPRGVASKRLSNARLRETGFKFIWPECRAGYASIIHSG